MSNEDGPRERLDSGAPAIPCSEDEGSQRVTLKMILLSIWVSWAAWIGSFDNGFAGTVLIMPSFQRAFGHCEVTPDPNTGDLIEQCNLSTLQQSLINLSILFMCVGSVISGVCGSKIGRRTTIQIACVFNLVGAAGMLGTSGSFSSYIVCKCIGGIGIGQLYASSLVYGSECVVASKRGLLLGIYNIGLAMGNVTVSAVCAGSAKLESNNDWQWKTPIACQIPLALSLALGMFMFPESPRWLLLKGKEELARDSFAAFQSRSPNSVEVTKQVDEVLQHLEIERRNEKSASWSEIYRGTNLRRTAVSVLVLVSLPLTGIQFVAPYAAFFLEGVGIENPYLINVIVALCIFGGAFIGPFVLDYGGRRFAMLAGYGFMAISMLIFSSVSTALGADDPTAQSVVVAFLCIWAFIFGGFIGSSVWLSSAEMHSIRLRTYGQANTTFIYNIFAFGASFWTPYMLNPAYGNMGANVGYFYFGVTVAFVILVFFFVPETSRLTLEQIDDYFMSGRRAWSTSTKKNIALVRTGIPSESKSGYSVGQSEAANSSSLTS
jgi:sugar porter (SP) family MFS transporter